MKKKYFTKILNFYIFFKIFHYFIKLYKMLYFFKKKLKILINFNKKKNYIF